MPIEIVVPRLGWSMDEGTFGEWLKSDGEQIDQGDMIFILEGEKASQEIESFDSGVLCIPADAPKPGDTVRVGQLLGYLLATGESAPARREISMVPEQQSRSEDRGEVTRIVESRSKRLAVTPRARRTARELGVDSAKIRGSGRHGRIRERDVLAFAAHETTDVQQSGSKIRRTIAQRMLAGAQQTAPVTLTTKVDASELVAVRDRLKAERSDRTIPSYNDILVKLVAAALPECPELNACWHGESVVFNDRIHIAIAIDTERGLVAPVIRDAASLSLDEIASQSRSLAEQARQGTLSQNQLQGGTFTITNLGMFDIDFFTPIINLPQSAILGIGRIAREPVVVGDQVVPGFRLGLSLTFDHRVIDGGPAARWLQRLAQIIQHPQQFVARANV